LAINKRIVPIFGKNCCYYRKNSVLLHRFCSL